MGALGACGSLALRGSAARCEYSGFVAGAGGTARVAQASSAAGSSRLPGEGAPPLGPPAGPGSPPAARCGLRRV